MTGALLRHRGLRAAWVVGTSHDPQFLLLHMGVSKNRGKTPQIINFNRVFHEINHPFWGTPIFGNTHMLNLWNLESDRDSSRLVISSDRADIWGFWKHFSAKAGEEYGGMATFDTWTVSQLVVYIYLSIYISFNNKWYVLYFAHFYQDIRDD